MGDVAREAAAPGALLTGLLSHIGNKDLEKPEFLGARNGRFHLLRAALPLLAREPGHAITIVSSLAGVRVVRSFALEEAETRAFAPLMLGETSRNLRRVFKLSEMMKAQAAVREALAQKAQAAMGQAHLQTALSVLKHYHFEEQRGSTLIRKEPIGVCGLITPWNWPVNQIACKVAPALATGCTMVLKPSEIAPFSAQIWTEILHAAGVPAGVFNLVNGDGPTVGAAISSHPGVDMVSFTGSTGAGIEVARNAAPTVKRVHQELGGKSPNLILPDADIKRAVTNGVRGVMTNSGQSCNAPTRMLVPNALMDEAISVARAAAEGTTVGAPDSGATIGPVISKRQWDKIQGLINKGIEEGAELLTGGRTARLAKRLVYDLELAQDVSATQRSSALGSQFQIAVTLRKDKKPDATGKPLFPAYHVKRFQGVPVAFIGLTLKETPTIVVPSGVEGLTFQDEAETVNALVPQLRARGSGMPILATSHIYSGLVNRPLDRDLNDVEFCDAPWLFGLATGLPSRDALAKTLYSRLFDWIVGSILVGAVMGFVVGWLAYMWAKWRAARRRKVQADDRTLPGDEGALQARYVDTEALLRDEVVPNGVGPLELCEVRNQRVFGVVLASHQGVEQRRHVVLLG